MERCKALRFRTPTSLLIAGPSGCGKTVFTSQLLLDNTELCDNSLKNSNGTAIPIHYCYGSWQKGFQKLQNEGIKFHEEIPESESLPKWFPEGGVLVLVMGEGSNDKSVLDLFTKDSHHQGITVLYLCQDLFPPEKFAKTISRNAHYIVSFKNPHDQLGMRNLLQQSFPTRWQDVMYTFRKVT